MYKYNKYIYTKLFNQFIFHIFKNISFNFTIVISYLNYLKFIL